MRNLIKTTIERALVSQNSGRRSVTSYDIVVFHVHSTYVQYVQVMFLRLTAKHFYVSIIRNNIICKTINISFWTR